jgi:hypothetical protein
MSELADLITTATDASQRALEPVLDADWSVTAGDLEWTCRHTAGHISDDLFSYASQVVARPIDTYLPVEAALDPAATPEQLVQCVAMCGELLRLAVAAAPAIARAWHPYGTSDPDGFAAMGITETLVHTYDITRGLGQAWAPPREVSAAVVARLFPGAPAGDPSAVLLWCTGRTALPDHPRRTAWRWDSTVQGAAT